MSSESPERTAERINTALISKVTIDYGSGFADKEYPEIVWSTYGLPETNEISVVAEVGNLKLGIAHVSGLAWPAMVDRKFGIDVGDQQLAFRLSDELWDAHSERLITGHCGSVSPCKGPLAVSAVPLADVPAWTGSQ